MKKTKLLLELIINLNILYDEKSTKAYNVLGPLLQEQSHSFGFKLFSDISSKNVELVCELFNNREYEYYSYERSSKKLSSQELVNKIIGDSKKGKIKELLNIIIMENLSYLKTQDKVMCDIFSKFFQKESEGFVPIAKCVKNIEKNLDLIIFKDIKEDIIKTRKNMEANFQK